MAEFPIKYTAQEAYDVAYQKLQERLRKSQAEINDLIAAAASRGEFSVMYSKQAELVYYDDIMNLLRRSYGYKVTEKEQEDGSKIWIINWEHPGVIDGD